MHSKEKNIESRYKMKLNKVRLELHIKQSKRINTSKYHESKVKYIEIEKLRLENKPIDVNCHIKNYNESK